MSLFTDAKNACHCVLDESHVTTEKERTGDVYVVVPAYNEVTVVEGVVHGLTRAATQ